MEDVLRDLVVPGDTRIVLLVVDGLGGLPGPAGQTELEAARHPHLDRLAEKADLGMLEMVGPGITPGSGAGHLALFGYDPLQYQIGRGILSALGIGIQPESGDIFARGNFCTLAEDGTILDRRAGRIATAVSAELCSWIESRIGRIEDVVIRLAPEKEHRFVLHLRGDSLSQFVTDTDPQKEGLRPLEAQATRSKGEKTARIVNEFVARALSALRARPRGGLGANGVLLRGFAGIPKIPLFADRTGLRPAAIATYPMYRGLARLLGMKVLPAAEDEDLSALGRSLADAWEGSDFFYVHVKKADSFGEDGDFEAKMRVLEEVDRVLVPAIEALRPDVFAVSGDHSTPAVMKGHSWHPVPLMIASRWTRFRKGATFGEGSCANGRLGTFPARDLMGMLLAHAGRLRKFGA